jgi:hypothetical protein
MNEFKEHVAVALSIAILLWKDATPTTAFPSIDELVKIELGRVLSHPHLFHEFPWLRSRIQPMQAMLTAEPWDVDPPELLRMYEQILHTEEEKRTLGKALREKTFMDPAFDMIIRHGKKPLANAESMITVSRGVIKELELPEETTRSIEDGVREQYRAIYSQLR